jgi:DNA-binding NtrC family response regulator
MHFIISICALSYFVTMQDPENKFIFIVEDEPANAQMLELWVSKRWGYRSRLFDTGEACLEKLHESPDLVLLDLMLPGMKGEQILTKIKSTNADIPVIILSAQDDVERAVQTLRLGATDYYSKPVDFPRLGNAVKNALQLHELAQEVQRLREQSAKPVHFDNIVSNSGLMQEVFRLVDKVKDSDICVLIMGESGTGKELVSKAIHHNGVRKQGPFVTVNCASIPHDLLESELFGHERGAFTGAVQRRIGRFEQANRGTLFLDEIGELDMSLQAKLLRVIQTKQFERVGGNETMTSDVRVISATNRDLQKAVHNKEFREDLYFRLSTFPVVIPPLRERRSDVLLLAEHFLKKHSEEEGKKKQGFSKKALRLLYQYHWPGNVRELENAIQRAILMSEGDTVTERDLPMAVQTLGSDEHADGPSGGTALGNGIRPFEQFKEEVIRHALKITEGNIVEAARQLKLGRATLYRLMKKYKITGNSNYRPAQTDS